MAASPGKTWQKRNLAFENYREFIEGKDEKFSLCLLDLLHVSNFKGGNASITEAGGSLGEKLQPYTRCLESIEAKFPCLTLGQLSPPQLEELIGLCEHLIALPDSKDSKIDGIGPSYASALGAAHFPNLVPILDRRAVNGAAINVEWSSNGQVKHLNKHYEALIRFCWSRLKCNRKLSLRDLDKSLFVVPTPTKSTRG